MSCNKIIKSILIHQKIRLKDQEFLGISRFFKRLSGVLEVLKKISEVIGISGICKNFKKSCLISDNQKFRIT
jgi:hypothetical protein